MESWEFEGYWYVQSPDSLPLCMNSKEAVKYLRKLKAVADEARIAVKGWRHGNVYLLDVETALGVLDKEG